MARKRKIPARKHHGIRDPLKQLEDKEKKLKHIVNSPPDRASNDQVSYKFQQFKKLADDAKAGKKMKRLHMGREDRGESRKKGKADTKSSSSPAPANTHKLIKQFIGEADEDYLKRVNRITSESLREATYEAKYGVNVIRDPKTGMITIKKKPKNEIDELLKQKQKDRLNSKRGRGKVSKKKQPELMDPKTAKELAKRAVKESAEEMRKERIERKEPSEYKQDHVKFGEIVHAPPTISTLPRKAEKSETVPRPGRKANLLLKNLLQGEDKTAEEGETTPAKTTKAKQKPSEVTKKQMKGKRKDLPAATRSMLENEQSKLIELYRNLKKAKMQQQAT